MLTSNSKLTELLKTKKIDSWNRLTHYVQNLPYGRNANRNDLSLVITENKGTCSSKHAFLKAVAIENNIEVKLIIGLYKMCLTNTPLIGSVLADNNLEYIPEAHCYLIINGKRKDYTFSCASFSKIELSLIEEIEIEPNQVVQFKVDYHKDYLKKWIEVESIDYSFKDIWKIREECIRNIETKKSS